MSKEGLKGAARSCWARARRPDQKRERREAILEAAGRLLDAGGVAAAGLSAIARQSEISKPNIYRYFESREAILMALLLREYDAWIERLLPRLAVAAGDAAPSVVGRAFAETLDERPRFCRLVAELATVLEHNVGREGIAAFKRHLNERSERLVTGLTSALPALTRRRAWTLGVMLVCAAAGMWPHCHPAPVVDEVLMEPEFSHLRLDFVTLATEHFSCLIRGFLAQPGASPD